MWRPLKFRFFAHTNPFSVSLYIPSKPWSISLYISSGPPAMAAMGGRQSPRVSADRVIPSFHFKPCAVGRVALVRPLVKSMSPKCRSAARRRVYRERPKHDPVTNHGRLQRQRADTQSLRVTTARSSRRRLCRSSRASCVCFLHVHTDACHL